MPLIVDSNKVITTPIQQIIEELRCHMVSLGIFKLDKVEYKGNNARVTCPIHKGGFESRPSCDILLYDKVIPCGSDTKIIPAGTVHCFTCGYSTNFLKLISDCLNIPYRKATEWLLGFCDYEIYVEPRDVGNLDIFSSDEEKTNYSELPIITCDDLKKYDYYHPYMEKRKLTVDVIDKFEVGYSPEEDALTFPVYVDGKCLFVAKRKVKYKQFIMPKVMPKPIYGLDYICGENKIYVTESIINALTLWSYGLKAVALFGTGSSYQIDKLNKLTARQLVICLDGDEAGIKGRNRIMKSIKDKIVTYIDFPSGKDINDLEKDEFFSLEEKF